MSDFASLQSKCWPISRKFHRRLGLSVGAYARLFLTERLGILSFALTVREIARKVSGLACRSE